MNNLVSFLRPRRLPLAAALLAGACSATDTTAPDQTLTVRLTDTPFSDARAVLVTFSEVSAHRSGEGGFEPIVFAGGTPTRTCDLKQLQGATDVLGIGALPAGHYTQLRIKVESATLYFDNPAAAPACAAAIAAPAGRSAPASVSSGEVKLNRQFEVEEDDATVITLDFDGDKSIHETGNGRFRMTPVITVVSVD